MPIERVDGQFEKVLKDLKKLKKLKKRLK